MAVEFVERLGVALQDQSCPSAVNQLERTIARWSARSMAPSPGVNGPTEAVNNLVKRVKRVAFGFRRFTHYRVRALLYAGRPHWDLLATITPR